jgi:predicted phage tail protein
MRATPAHYAYSRKVVQAIAPWFALGGGFEALAAGGMAAHARPLGAGAMLMGAALLWTGVWRMFSWRRAHPFDTFSADEQDR